MDSTPLAPPQEIVPGLFRLRTPMMSSALPFVMPYAFLGPNGVTLFDAGYGIDPAEAAMADQLAAIGRHPSDIERLIVSHAHADHIGMAAWVKKQSPKSELILTRIEGEHYGRHTHNRWENEMSGWGVSHGFDRAEVEEAERIERQEREESSSTDAAAATERSAWEMERVTPDVLLEDGQELTFDGWTLRAVWTPGHTPGHLCVYEPNHRLTLTGDHVLSRITPNVSLGQDDEESGRHPLEEFIASQKKVAALDTVLGLPAHEDVLPNLPERCSFLIEHHDHRADEVMSGIGEGAPTALEVASRVTWNKPWSTFGIHKRRSAMGETLAHLDLLLQQGRVRRHVDDDGRIRWERAT